VYSFLRSPCSHLTCRAASRQAFHAILHSVTLGHDSTEAGRPRAEGFVFEETTLRTGTPTRNDLLNLSPEISSWEQKSSEVF
jgi:hypothetical protein